MCVCGDMVKCVSVVDSAGNEALGGMMKGVSVVCPATNKARMKCVSGGKGAFQ